MLYFNDKILFDENLLLTPKRDLIGVIRTLRQTTKEFYTYTQATDIAKRQLVMKI